MSETRRIAQVIGTFGAGGAERMAYNLGLALHRAGMSSVGISIRRAGGFAASREGFPVLCLEAGTGGVLPTLRAAFRFRRLVAKERIDVVHIHGAASLPLCAVATFGMLRAPKMFFTWHNSENVLKGSGLSHRLTLWALRRCTIVFGASHRIVDQLRDISGLTDNVEIFRNGVPPIPASGGVNTEEPTLLWAARITPAKDPEILLRAAARLKNEGLRFKVVLAGGGNSDYVAGIERLVRDLNLQATVDLPGWIENIQPLLTTSAIGVQTSLGEGLSMTLLEQMMAGLAVVATDVGDTSEAIETGRSGLLIAPRDEEALTNALRLLIQDRDLRLRLGAAARAKALCRFGMESMARHACEKYGIECAAAHTPQFTGVLP